MSGHISKQAMKKLLDVRTDMQRKAQEHKETSDDESSSDDSYYAQQPPPLNIKKHVIKPIS